MRLRPIASAAAAVALVLGGLAGPAQAAAPEPSPLLIVRLDHTIRVLEGGSKTVDVTVTNDGPVAAKDVVLTFWNIDPEVKLTLPGSCRELTCPIGDVGARNGTHLTIGVELIGITAKPTPASFGVKSNYYAVEANAWVVHYKRGLDLAVTPLANPVIGRGGSTAVPIVVRNDGTETINKIGLVLRGDFGLEPTSRDRDCVSFDDIDDPKTYGKLPRSGSWGPAVFCTFDVDLPPGATFRPPADASMRIAVDDDLGGPFAYRGNVTAVALGDGPDPVDVESGVGNSGQDQFSYLTARTDFNYLDNFTHFFIPLDKSLADSAAVGGALTGTVGETKTLKVGIHNLGPTTVIDGVFDHHENWTPKVRVHIPTGLRLTSVDKECKPGTDPDKTDNWSSGKVDGWDYICSTRPWQRGAAVGEKVLLTFTGKLTGESAPGWVAADGGQQDTEPKNDRAAITIALDGAGGGANPGGANPGGENPGGEGGGLPITGAPVEWVALGGAVLLVAGAVAAFVFRRRRIVTTL
ncbi:hypothetical protein [Paractinoplanes hotanensis]|uniref:LPXTG cell wall anchor domain-containing protein n=1 Tax=Paractinoplanes hotanensis TaxID=2906497 RepID=A0ABT0XZW0_9ACTN|nr:hypothetical protein [Actinoplanes hotanensis]MCM4079327.1 hypothetical protein [Actinoplanes hotanensis]